MGQTRFSLGGTRGQNQQHSFRGATKLMKPMYAYATMPADESNMYRVSV